MRRVSLGIERSGIGGAEGIDRLPRQGGQDDGLSMFDWCV